MEKQNAQTDRRRERRVLPEAQLITLLTVAEKCARTFRGMAGRDRLMIYSTAMYTGYRASEIASLTPASFALNETPAFVTAEAAYTKNRTKTAQTIPP